MSSPAEKSCGSAKKERANTSKSQMSGFVGEAQPVEEVGGGLAVVASIGGGKLDVDEFNRSRDVDIEEPAEGKRRTLPDEPEEIERWSPGDRGEGVRGASAMAEGVVVDGLQAVKLRDLPD